MVEVHVDCCYTFVIATLNADSVIEALYDSCIRHCCCAPVAIMKNTESHHQHCNPHHHYSHMASDCHCCCHSTPALLPEAHIMPHCLQEHNHHQGTLNVLC